MDEDDDYSDDMGMSIDEVLVDDDYALSPRDYNPSIKSLLAPQLDRLLGIQYVMAIIDNEL